MSPLNETEDRPIRPAATIILLRDINSIDSPAFQAAMIERHKGMAFAGGATVFPGGAVDPSDSDKRWPSLCDGLSADRIIARGQIAAIREAFEEIGILLARNHDEQGFVSSEKVTALQEWRSRIEADGAHFIKMVTENNLRLTCDRLVLFAHWIGPPHISKRYDTLFFAARAPTDQKLIQDGVEATSATWISPKKALDDLEQNKRRIIFPTARNLELLCVKETIDETLNWANERKIEPIIPGGEIKDGKLYLILPDGFGYPETRFLAKEAVNS
ncbi:MAG: NUDIX hydrolase [Pseudomonadota bacterium]